ncbi:unnamed protein product [Absidia cylindrospora]
MQACLVCRRKKTKCDGKKPVCNNCQRLDQVCTYGPLQQKRTRRRKHIDVLEQRLEQMEKLLKPRNETPQSAPWKQQQEQQEQRQQKQQQKQPQHLQRQTPFIKNSMTNPDNTDDENILPPINVDHCLTINRNHHQVIDMDRRLLPPRHIMEHIIERYLDRIYGVSPFFYRDDLLNIDACPAVVLMAITAATAKFSDYSEMLEQPLWLSGERYAEKIRQRINDIVDMPSISHVQVMMLMIMHEFGCARGSRTWVYCGIAGRMVLELGLHKEPTHMIRDGDIISVEAWKNNELRRNVFWGMYIFDRFGGASCARPVLFNDDDIECHLPCQDDCLDSETTFYSESLDGTELIRYEVVDRDSSGGAESIRLVETISQNPTNRPRCNLGWPTHMVRITSLFSKVATFVNRTMAKSNSPFAPYDMDSNDYSILTEELDLWCHQLPFSMRNTPANLERHRSDESRDTHRFLLSHILYNALVVFLNRPALTLMDNIKNPDDIPVHLKESIQLGIEKCLAASDNVTIMLTDINLHFKRVFPFLTYLTYSTATVVVHTIFTGTPSEAKKSAEALKSHCLFLQNMRKYFAMADNFFFRIRDFYALHKNQLQSRDEEFNNTSDNLLGNSNVSSASDSAISSETEKQTRCLLGSDSSATNSLNGLLPRNNNQVLDDLMGSLDDTFNQLLDQQLQPLFTTTSLVDPPLTNNSDSSICNNDSNNVTGRSWPLYPYDTQHQYGMLPTSTSTEPDYYSVWPFPQVNDPGLQ